MLLRNTQHSLVHTCELPADPTASVPTLKLKRCQEAGEPNHIVIDGVGIRQGGGIGPAYRPRLTQVADTQRVLTHFHKSEGQNSLRV